MTGEYSSAGKLGGWVSTLTVREQRESTTRRTMKRRLQRFSGRKLKEIHAHELDPTKPFLAQRDRKRTVADLLDALKADFQIRGIASSQNLVKHLTLP